MSDALTPEQLRRIDDELAAGRKIQAIEIYREATGSGLTEAKTAIDDVAAKLAEKNPEKYPEVRKGCVLLLCIGGAVAGIGCVAASVLG